MSEFTKALLVANIYRYLLIIAGVWIVYMGYRLFVLGYFEKGGELKASFGDNHLLLRQVAPGVFFALLGVAAIAVGIVRQIQVSVPVAGGDSQYKNSMPKPSASGQEPSLSQQPVPDIVSQPYVEKKKLQNPLTAQIPTPNIGSQMKQDPCDNVAKEEYFGTAKDRQKKDAKLPKLPPQN